MGETISWINHTQITMHHAAFLSALAGLEVAQAAAQAALTTLSELEKEELDVEKAISEIIEVQMKNIQDKLVHFEDLDLLMEKEGQQMEQMKNMFFLDQLTLLFHKSSAPKTGE
ncbi:hypothetical protein JHK82_055143 [Glycine max]|nr:hypothetical protein JHK84_055004 [Glycine max]KAG5076448.1 hypothetical protein JHK82_055143 [Glycine max]